MANKTTYTKRDIERFRRTLIAFLKRHIPPDKKWYENDNSLTISGGTLEGFLYGKKRQKLHSAGIYKFAGMKAVTFNELMANFTVEKHGEGIEAQKDQLRAMYQEWSIAKIAHNHKVRQKRRLPAKKAVNPLEEVTELDVQAVMDAETQPADYAQPQALNSILQTDVLPTPVEIPAIKQPSPARSLSRYHYLLVLLVALGLFGFGVFMWGQNAPQQIEITENSQWVPVYQQHADIPMVYVPPGCFAMGYLHGEASEKPVQRMCLEGFWLAETETTIGQYGEIPIESCNIDQITKEELVNDPTPNNPMNCVTWEEAHNFCVARGMRLPTEVEWEYASRGPSNWLYPWGNDPESTYTTVRIDPNAPRPVMPVGSMSRDTSWVGAKDMAGSIREFTSTIHNQAMGTNTPFEMPYNPDDGRESLENIGTWVDWSGTTRVVKGGNFDLPIANARASLRYDEFFDFRFNHYGFRCAMDA